MPLSVTLSPTTTLTTIGGARVRVWEGTYKGSLVVAFIATISVLDDSPAAAEFSRELLETIAPPGVRILLPEDPKG